jgi:hypothetical protein
MERLLARLERRLGRFAIPNLTSFIVGGTALVFVLATLRPSFLSMILLNIHRVKQGEVWRLVTYLFIPPSDYPILVLFSLYVTWLIGSNLDNEWGAFKFNLYYFFGMVGTTIAAVLTQGAVGNTYLNLSLFFAFATVFPDYEFFLFFILRIKVKWLALLTAAFVLYEFVVSDWVARAAIAASILNYLLFFGGHLIGLLRGRNMEIRQAARRTSMRAPAKAEAPSRNCAICGVSEADGADIRVCSCATCGGKPRNLCLMHAKKH